MKQSTDPAGMDTPATADAASTPAEQAPAVNTAELQERVIDALREVYDPELPVNIYDLGLIYTCEIDEQGRSSARCVPYPG